MSRLLFLLHLVRLLSRAVAAGEAADEYREVLRLRPDHPQAREALSRLLAGR